MKWNLLVSLALAVVVAATTAGLTAQRQYSSGWARPPDPGGADGGPGQQRHRALLSWPPGQSQIYALDLTQARLGSTAPPIVRLEGWLTLTPILDAPERVLRGQFTGRVTGFGGPASGAAGAAGEDLAQDAFTRSMAAPFFWTYSPRGEFVDLRAASDVLPLAAQLWRAMGSLVQLRTPEGCSSAWTAVESDANGRYLAAHELVEEGAGSRVRKRKVRYVTGPSFHVAYDVVASTAAFVLDAQRSLESLELDETLRAVVVGDLVPPTEARTTIRAVRRAVEPAGSTLHSALTEYQALAVFEPEKEVRARAAAEIDRARIASAATPEAERAPRQLPTVPAIPALRHLEVVRGPGRAEPVVGTLEALRSPTPDPLLGRQATYGSRRR